MSIQQLRATGTGRVAIDAPTTPTYADTDLSLPPPPVFKGGAVGDAGNVWVEKYRPQQMAGMVLTPRTRRLFDNILLQGQCPHLLLHGPPGVGKTTAVLNLVREFRWSDAPIDAENQVLHLNASDTRSLQVVHQQISAFVTSSTMFCSGIKFVVLDEVDHMSKRAQLALVSLIQRTSHADSAAPPAAPRAPVRFCLMCNYLSKLDARLRAELVNVHFVNLPHRDILVHLRAVCHAEQLPLTDATILSIQQMFQSDIRCMLNYLQSNQVDLRARRLPVPDAEALEQLLALCAAREPSMATVMRAWEDMEVTYQIDRHMSIPLVFRHLLCHHMPRLTPGVLDAFRTVIHGPSTQPPAVALHCVAGALMRALRAGATT